MLKIVASRCLLKNYKFHKYLKYVQYSTGSDNDQNDKDKSSPKSKNDKTDTTKTDSNSNNLVSMLNNLLEKKDNFQPIKTNQNFSRNKNREIESSKKFVFDKKKLRKENIVPDMELQEMLSKSLEKTIQYAKLKDNNSETNTEMDSSELKENLFKTPSGDTNKSSLGHKTILSKSSKKNAGLTISKDDNTKEANDSDFIKLKGILSKVLVEDINKSSPINKDENFIKEILSKSNKSKDNIKKVQTDHRLTDFKNMLMNFDSSVQKDSRKARIHFDFENYNKNATSNLNDKKSPVSISSENFKNLLSSCKVEATNKLVVEKESFENEMSVSDYLKSILQIDLFFKDNEMENDIKPFSIGKIDTEEVFTKLINEIPIGDTAKAPVIHYTSGDSFVSKSDLTMRLNIFTKTDPKKQTETDNNTSIIELIESQEYRKLNSNIPTSYFHECIQLTRDKVMRNFPIDNDQDSEELNIGFHEHVFPQQYLTGKLPNTGVTGEFMNYVCMGLSNNPHLTIERKKAHVRWYEEYLSNKQEEIDLATKKTMDDLEYEKSLRNK